jgi:hypothetical protein
MKFDSQNADLVQPFRDQWLQRLAASKDTEKHSKIKLKKRYTKGMVDGEAVCSDMMTYLTTNSFNYFAASDVTNYPGQNQIWVNATDGVQGNKKRLIFDYGRFTNVFEVVTGAVAGESAFYDEVQTIAVEFGLCVDEHTV